MDDIARSVDDLMNLMEKNIRGVQIGCYSLALIGLTVAIRKVRPFSQFVKPSDVPNNFLRERRLLAGRVQRVEPNGSLLMVRHKPLVSVPFQKKGELPVKILGVDVSGLGLNWLQSVVTGNAVNIIPVLKDKNCIHCEVMMPKTISKKKVQSINLGEELINIGFGSLLEIQKPLKSDPKCLIYYNRLKIAEAQALRKKLGFMYYVQPTKNVLSSVSKKIIKLLLNIIKQDKKVPKLTIT